MVFISNNINTGSKSFGSFFVTGNTYITGNLVVAGNLIADYWSVSQGLDIYGNLNILGNFTISANVNFASTEDAYSTSTGALRIAGGLSIQKNIAIGGNIITFGDLNFTSTTDSTSPNNGALVINGGLGVAKNLNVGDTLKISQSLILPQGTTAQRSLYPREGELRYNTDFNDCEVFDKNDNWRSIFNAQDLDKNTKIAIDDQINDDIIRIYTQGNQRVMFGNNADSGNIAIGLGFNSPKSTLDILGNLSISSNAYFNKGIILGNTLNNPELINGSIRYSGLDIEGYVNSNWVSLTNPQDVLSFHTDHPFISHQFHVSQVKQTHRIGNRILGNPNELSNMFGHLYYLKYQLLNTRVTFTKLEVAIDDETVLNFATSYDVEIYVNDILLNTITVTNIKGSYAPILTSITNLVVMEGDRISFNAKANNADSEDAEILITCHGIYAPKQINISGNLHHAFNNNITFKQNVTVTDNLNVTSNLNILAGGGLNLGFIDDKLEGRVRFTGSDFEGCVGNDWVSLTRSEDTGIFSSTMPYKSHQFQMSKSELTYKYINRCLGVNNLIYLGSFYEFKYEKVNEPITFEYVEVILEEQSIDNINALEFTLIIEVNNVNSKTVTLSFAAGEYSKIFTISGKLPTIADDIISMKIKGNDSFSVDLDLIISLLGEAPLRTLTLHGNTNMLFNSNVTFNSDITVNANSIFNGNLICAEPVYINDIVQITDSKLSLLPTLDIIGNLSVTGNAYFNSGIIVGNNTSDVTGTIRFHNQIFQGYNGNHWTGLGNNDADNNTKITVEQNTNEDIIRFYSQGNQRMMISNNNDSGFIGIGLGFNSPKSTLDIIGNLSVSGNSYFNSGLILGNNTSDIVGTIRYQNNDFQGYVLGNWSSLVSQQDFVDIKTAFPFKSQQFELRKTSESYEYANRATGLGPADVVELGTGYIYKYEKINEIVTFNTLEIIQDNVSLLDNNFNFTLQIEVNDVVQLTETFTFTQFEYDPKLITLASTITVAVNDTISFKLKADDGTSIDADLLFYLIGETPINTVMISGNLNMLFNNSVTALKDFTMNQNCNINGNLNVTTNLNVDGFSIFNNYVGIGLAPLYQLHLSTDSAAKPSTNTWTISSDSRIKKNIQSLSKDELYNISKNFNVRKYEFIDTYRKAHQLKDKYYLGIIADEINEYMPCCIDKYNLKYKIGTNLNNEDIFEEIIDCLNYNGSELQFALFGCIPHILKDNEKLEKRVNKLEKDIYNILNKHRNN